MFNYLLKIEYDGTNFVGWQSQKREINTEQYWESLKRVLKTQIRIPGSGRTDKGVHVYSICKF